jgi:hypothetical protein
LIAGGKKERKPSFQAPSNVLVAALRCRGQAATASWYRDKMWVLQVQQVSSSVEKLQIPRFELSVMLLMQ